jgi:uroporphyrinogen decarboxylase
MAENDLLIRAARCEATERTPVWMMRQAGRFLPEYRAVRAQHSFLEMCYNPELVVEVTLQPVDLLGVDAAIIFSDILVVFPGMGLELDFQSGRGPVIGNPIANAAEVDALVIPDPEDSMGYVMQSHRLLRRELEGRVPLIGFAGAPFTLASYAIEGGSTREFSRCKAFMWNEPEAWDRLMMKFAKTVAAYLCAQIDAGAQVLQLFDSWVGAVAPRDYERAVLPYTKMVLDEVKAYDSTVPLIHFANGATSMLDLVQRAGGDVIGLDWRLDMAHAVEQIDPRFALQGNIDPMALFASDRVIDAKVAEILTAVGTRPGHIFNLGHGISKETDPARAKHFIAAVKEQSEAIRSAQA